MPEFESNNADFDFADENLIYEDNVDPIDEYIKRKSKRAKRRHDFKRRQKKQADIVSYSPYLSGYIKREGAGKKTYYLKHSLGSKSLKKESSRAFRNDITQVGRKRSFFKKVYDYWWNLW